MTWTQSIDPFLWGFALGWLSHIIWPILKKIVHEAKIAKKEWRNPNGN